jgi:hypothetical protein
MVIKSARVAPVVSFGKDIDDRRVTSTGASMRTGTSVLLKCKLHLVRKRHFETTYAGGALAFKLD